MSVIFWTAAAGSLIFALGLISALGSRHQQRARKACTQFKWEGRQLSGAPHIHSDSCGEVMPDTRMEPTLTEGDEQGYVYSYATVRGAVEWRDHQIAVLEERNAFLEQRNAALVATINRLMQPGAAL